MLRKRRQVRETDIVLQAKMARMREDLQVRSKTRVNKFACRYIRPGLVHHLLSYFANSLNPLTRVAAAAAAIGNPQRYTGKRGANFLAVDKMTS